MAFASNPGDPVRPALIPIRLHCRGCLCAAMFCPRCGSELLVKGPASHVATNHLVRRDCGECSATFGLLLDGYQEDASSFSPCPSADPAPAIAEQLTAQPTRPAASGLTDGDGDRRQLSLPVVLLSEPTTSGLGATDAGAAVRPVATPRASQRQALALRLWWQLGHPAAKRDGSTIAAAYRAAYGTPVPKKQGRNVYLKAELDAVEEYLVAEQWTQQAN
jgi:hypothetical protein